MIAELWRKSICFDIVRREEVGAKTPRQFRGRRLRPTGQKPEFRCSSIYTIIG